MASSGSSSSSEEDVLILEYAMQRKSKKFNLHREQLLWDDSEFFARFRMSKSVVKTLVDLIGNDIKSITNRNHAVSPTEQTLLALRFYATGSMQRSVGDVSGLDKSTVSRIIWKVTKAIAKLRPTFIFMPRNPEEIASTVSAFYKTARFPKVIGAIDCTHVPIQSPGGDNAEYYRNRKDYFSFNVQMVVNANMLITNIVARWPGGTHDSHIFNSSSIKGRLESGEFGDKVIVGDGGYGIKPYMLTPLRNPVSPEQNLYNESQIRTRNVVERTFGVIKRRFPVLSSKIKMQVDKVQGIIVATAVLHNICRQNNEDQPPVFIEALEEVNDVPVQAPTINRGDDRVRQTLISSYFARLIDE